MAAQTVLLGDICDVRDGTHDSPKPKEIGHPLVTSKHIKNYKIDFSTANLISKEDFEAVNKRSKVDKYDILISMIGTVGELALIDYEPTFAIKNIGLIKTGDELLGKYLFYYLQSTKAKQYIEASLAGSTQKFIGLGQLRKFPIELPDLETQKKIADILGTIDEKIELNRRMNETLEQMGQALFRHYFIDNPEAEKWEEGTLGDIIINFDSKRKPLSSRQRTEMKGDYRYFGATSVMDYVNDYLFDGKYLLLAEDGSVMKSDNTPYLQYIWGKFWVNNHAHILQAKSPFTVEYLYLLLSQANVQSLVSGAVQLKINQRAMNNFKIKRPPNELVKEFCERIDSMFEQRRKNENEIQTLTTLRDTLLPQLISGRIKI